MWFEFKDDSLGDQAAAMSFFTLLSLPAAALAMVTGLGSLEGLVGIDLATDARNAISDYVQTTFGSESLSSTVDGLFEENRSGLLTVSLAVAIYSLSRGFAGLVRGLDVAYDIETSRSWLNVRLVGVAIGFGTLGVVGFAVYLAYGLWPSSAGPVLDTLGTVALFFGLTAWAATLFHIAPDHRTPWRWDVPGALLASLSWVLLASGFATYVGVAGGGNGAVGAVGAALLAFTLVYLLNLALLLGAELNGIIADRAGVARPPRRLHHLTRRSRSRPSDT